MAETQKRIRLTETDCQIIHAGLRNLDILPRTKEGLKSWEAEKLKTWILNNFEFPPETTKSMQISNLSRRFSCLGENDGFYARGSRRAKK